MNKRLSLLCLLIRSLQCFEDQYTRTVSYKGEVLVRCSSLEREEAQGLLDSDSIDVWRAGDGGEMDFRVSSEQFQEMRDDHPGCREVGSVEALVKDEERRRADSASQQDWFKQYHRYSAIVDWWERLARSNPSLVRFVESIGKSYEGRDQPAVHITASLDPDVRKIYFQCQIHAREWISGATCMYVANKLVEQYNRGDEEVTSLLRQVEIIYVPFVNPDGYEFTWTDNRLWRKNRRPPPEGSDCYGVDLNRNYYDHWGGGGSSASSCSQTYHGTSAFSEPESMNTANYFRKQGNIVGAIDWHSYDQLILRPYGWTLADSPDEAQLKSLGDKMSEDIFRVGGKKYISEKSIKLYMTTGTAADWFYSDDANENSPYRAAGYIVELRDTGNYGFELPPDQIIPSGREIVPAVIRFAKEMSTHPILMKREAS